MLPEVCRLAEGLLPHDLGCDVTASSEQPRPWNLVDVACLLVKAHVWHLAPHDSTFLLFFICYFWGAFSNNGRTGGASREHDVDKSQTSATPETKHLRITPIEACMCKIMPKRCL